MGEASCDGERVELARERLCEVWDIELCSATGVGAVMALTVQETNVEVCDSGVDDIGNTGDPEVEPINACSMLSTPQDEHRLIVQRTADRLADQIGRLGSAECLRWHRCQLLLRLLRLLS